jgi:hypothetical protein
MKQRRKIPIIVPQATLTSTTTTTPTPTVTGAHNRTEEDSRCESEEHTIKFNT